jgi:hypothetical protein
MFRLILKLYQSIDGCLIDIENGRFFYDPNISINNKELQNITNFLHLFTFQTQIV